MKRKKSLSKSIVKSTARGAQLGRNILHPDPFNILLDLASSINPTTTAGAIRGRSQKPIKIDGKIRYAKYNEKDKRIAIKSTPGKWKNVRMKRKQLYEYVLYL